MSLSRRDFLKAVGVSAAGAGLVNLSSCARDKMVSIPAMAPLKPPFRLTEEWYRKTVQRLQAKLSENGLDGLILEDRWNIIYFSGLFHTTTERPFWLFIPTKGEPVF
ncbi:MAG: aminopeptidase P family N-terminal domain-containing protein, partial [bacterium]